MSTDPGALSRLTSLDLLRGFVAVGRRMSITLAAHDLCLTQSAVSRQIRGLEDALGVRLLARGHRSVSFTPEGARLFRVADAAVQQLQDAVAALRAGRDRRPVTITASIGVTALWLLPRLGRFQQQHPSIAVRVAANNRLLDLRAEGVDLAIRYGPERDAPPGSSRLFGETVVPVAHPSLGVTRLSTAAELAAVVLLELDDPDRPWLHWASRLAAMGLGRAAPRGLLSFNQYDQVIQAAMAGQGVALGRVALVQPMLADGRLAAIGAMAEVAPQGYAYWLVQADPEVREDVQRVVQWVRDEARAVEADLPPPAAVARAGRPSAAPRPRR